MDSAGISGERAVARAARLAATVAGIRPGDFTPVAPMFAAGATEAPIELHRVDPRRPTALAFGAFRRSLVASDLNIVHVKDVVNAAYQTGLPGIGSTVEECAETLLDLVPPGSEIIGAIGASIDGLGALLYGSQLRLPRVLLFNPQTVLPEDLALQRVGDIAPHLGIPSRWLLDYMLSRQTADILRCAEGLVDSAITVHVSGRSADDVTHAERIQHLPGVTLIRHPCPEHNLAGWLWERGLLQDAIANGLGLGP